MFNIGDLAWRLLGKVKVPLCFPYLSQDDDDDDPSLVHELLIGVSGDVEKLYTVNC